MGMEVDGEKAVDMDGEMLLLVLFVFLASSDLRSLTDNKKAIMSLLRLLNISMDVRLVSILHQHSGNSLLRLVGLSFIQLRYCVFAVFEPLLAILELHC